MENYNDYQITVPNGTYKFEPKSHNCNFEDGGDIYEVLKSHGKGQYIFSGLIRVPTYRKPAILTRLLIALKSIKLKMWK